MSVQELLVGLERAVDSGEHRVWAVRCAHALGLEGIAVSLRWGAELVWFSDDIGARLEDAQFTLGQGPGMTTDFSEVPHQVADLGAGAGERWPNFAFEAQSPGVRAVFVWPVRTGGARFGALTGYRRSPRGRCPHGRRWTGCGWPTEQGHEQGRQDCPGLRRERPNRRLPD
ncbi:hypothetical protein [Streptomyces sp. Ac-502]|uniref:hypothetical protein n=1 Tax=Streptomyces sp. Ac-502 TaxID=3342801 RepID=UPI003862B850